MKRKNLFHPFIGQKRFSSQVLPRTSPPDDVILWL
jgi:hypothetical protein